MTCQVEVKRTVPREEMPKAGIKTKKIFVGGIPTSLTEGRYQLLGHYHVAQIGIDFIIKKFQMT